MFYLQYCLISSDSIAFASTIFSYFFTCLATELNELPWETLYFY